MKNYIQWLLASICLLASTGCSDSTGGEVPTEPSITISNQALIKALSSRGYTFDEGKLVQDKKVLETKSLDLSDCDLETLDGLQAFESLEVLNINNNALGPDMFMSHLPASLKSLSLTGNNVVNIHQLAQKNPLSGAYVAQVKLEKLSLPSSALHNREEVVYFYLSPTGQTCDMTVVDNDGASTQYSSLRTVPDENLRTYLMANFPSIFDAPSQKIDMSKTLDTTTSEHKQDIVYRKGGGYEGIQYVLSAPNYQGKQVILVDEEQETDTRVEASLVATTTKVASFTSLGTVTVPTSVETFCLLSATVDSLDLSKCSNLKKIKLKSIDDLHTVDLTKATSLLTGTHQMQYQVSVEGCQQVSKIAWPEVTQASSGQLYFAHLPELKELSLLPFESLHTLVLFNLPQCSVQFPTLVSYTNGWGVDSSESTVQVAMTDDIATQASTFVQTLANKEKIKDVGSIYGQFSGVTSVDLSF